MEIWCGFFVFINLYCSFRVSGTPYNRPPWYPRIRKLCLRCIYLCIIAFIEAIGSILAHTQCFWVFIGNFDCLLVLYKDCFWTLRLWSLVLQVGPCQSIIPSAIPYVFPLVWCFWPFLPNGSKDLPNFCMSVDGNKAHDLPNFLHECRGE